jgi:hypothetical protein
MGMSNLVPPGSDADAVAEPPPEPPVVARLIVEIRSDGRLTIARGALEDATTGERTAVEARGETPLALLTALARTVRHLPALARRATRALLTGRR